jgi:hypothetical protein
MRKAASWPLAEAKPLLEVLAEKADGLLGTSVSIGHDLAQGHGRTSGDRSAGWSGLATSSSITDLEQA